MALIGDVDSTGCAGATGTMMHVVWSGKSGPTYEELYEMERWSLAALSGFQKRTSSRG